MIVKFLDCRSVREEGSRVTRARAGYSTKREQRVLEWHAVNGAWIGERSLQDHEEGRKLQCTPPRSHGAGRVATGVPELGDVVGCGEGNRGGQSCQTTRR